MNGTQCSDLSSTMFIIFKTDKATLYRCRSGTNHVQIHVRWAVRSLARLAALILGRPSAFADVAPANDAISCRGRMLRALEDEDGRPLGRVARPHEKQTLTRHSLKAPTTI